MPIIHNNMDCPCKDCIYHTIREYEDFCKKKQKRIYQHNGNLYHYKGQWIRPCGGYNYKSKE